MMADPGLSVGGGKVDADYVEADGPVGELMGSGELAGEGDEFTLFWEIHVHFGTKGVGGVGIFCRRSFDFDDDHGVPVRRFGENVDFTEAVSQVAAKDAVSMVPQMASSKNLAGLSGTQRRAQASSYKGRDAIEKSHES